MELKRPIWRDDVGLSRDLTDNSQALQQLLDLGQPIYVESGVYNFTSPVTTSKEVSIIGIGDVIFNVPKNFFTARNSFTSERITVSNDTVYCEHEFDYVALEQYADLPGIRGPGIAVLLKPKGKIDAGYKLWESSLFNIDSTFINRAFESKNLTIKNIDFKLQDSEIGTRACNIWGYEVDFDNVSFYGRGQVSDGALFYGCPKVSVTNGHYQSLRYGLLVNNCTNVRVVHSDVFYCRHLAALATWTKDVFISDVYAYGCRTPIESHLAYNVHYDNVRTVQNGQINLRGFGELKITNSDIKTSNEIGNETSYSLIGYHFTRGLVGTPYEFLLDQTKITLDGVKYQETLPGKFRGLTASGYKSLTIRNCESSALGGYENYTKDSKLYISASKTGLLQLNKSSNGVIQVDDVLIDANLSPVNYVIEKPPSVESFFNGLRFINSECCNLLAVWNGSGHHPAKHMNFINTFGKLKGLAGGFTGNSNPYHKMHFVGSEVALDQDLEPLFGGRDPREFITTNGSVITFNNDEISDPVLQSIR